MAVASAPATGPFAALQVRHPWIADALGIGVPIAIAALLIVHEILRAPVWNDEAYSLGFGRLSWADLWTATRHLDAPLLPYYALLHFWGAGAPSLRAGRILSALAALPTLPLVYAIGVRLCGRAAGFGASLLCALNGSFLGAASQVRMYGLVETLDTAGWLALLVAARRPTPMRLAAYGVIVAVSLYAQPLAALNVAAQAVAIAIFSIRNRSLALPFVAALAAAAVLTVPLLALAPGSNIGPLYWLTEEPTPLWIWTTIIAGSFGIVPALVGTILSGAAVATVARGRDDAAIVLPLWLLVPPALAIGISLAVHPIFIPRYLIETIPAASLLIAIFVVRANTSVRDVSIALLCLGAGFGAATFSTIPLTNWPALLGTLHQNVLPGDALVFSESTTRFSYEVARENVEQRPPELDVAYPRTAPIWSDARTDKPIRFASDAPRLWLVTFGALSTERGREGLRASGFHAVESHVWSDLVLERYAPNERR